MNKKSVMLQGMSRELKLSYFCAGRVTVGEIESPEKARLYGQSVLAAWRKELADL